MRVFVLLLLAAAGSACAAGSAPSTAPSGALKFSGVILAMNGTHVGEPIAGAELTVVSGANANARVTADARGHYAFDNLESGRFTVAIAAPGYVSAKPVVDLYRDLEANFALPPR